MRLKKNICVKSFEFLTREGVTIVNATIIMTRKVESVNQQC